MKKIKKFFKKIKEFDVLAFVLSRRRSVLQERIDFREDMILFYKNIIATAKLTVVDNETKILELKEQIAFTQDKIDKIDKL